MNTTKINIVIPKLSISIGAIQTISFKDESCGDAKLGRTRIDRKRAVELFRGGHVHVASQLFPFYIVINNIFTDGSSKNINTYMENCWFKEISMVYTADDVIILNDAEVMFDDLYSLNEDEEIIKDIIE